MYSILKTRIAQGHRTTKFPLELPVLVEAGFILVLTVASCLGTYALARVVPILRLPLGLKSVPSRRTLATAGAS